MRITNAFDFRLSRNARATWYLSHLHEELSVKKYESCAGENTFQSNIRSDSQSSS